MRQRNRNWLKSLLALTLAMFCLPVAAQAQGNDKPLVIVSISKLSELTSDIKMITELAGQADAGNVAVGMAGIFTNGIDKTKPAGAVVSLTATGPKVLAFIPVTNLKTMLATHRERIGTPTDKGNGVLEVGADRRQSMFVKEQGGYAFISQDANALAGLPENPVALLDGMDQKYDLGVRLNMANIPAEYRDLIISQMKMGFDQAMRQNNRNLGADERKAAEAMSRSAMQSVVDFVEQADQLTFGFAIDAKAKNMFVETTTTAKAGSDLAKQMSSMGSITSQFTGITAGDPAALLSFAVPLSKGDIAQLTQLVQTGREAALKNLEADTKLPDQKSRDVVKSVIVDFADVLTASVQKGKVDGAAAVRLGGSSLEFVAGGFFADGLKMEAAVKRVIEQVKSLPGVPNIPIETSTHQGVNIHKIDVPVNDNDASKVLGTNTQVALGFGKESAFFAIGPDAAGSLKKSIGGATPDSKSAPVQGKVQLSPIFKFAAKVDSNPQSQMLAAATQKCEGNDHVLMTVKPIERGSATRIEFGSGVFQILGEVAKAAQGGGR